MAWIALLLIILSLTSCRFLGNETVPNQAFEIPEELLLDQPLEVAPAVIEEMVQNISSPVETAALIKGLGVPFNTRYLASTRYASRFVTNFQKALGLGIYGANLGYLNMYEKTSQVVDYISTIKSLADGIHVGQFFDFTTLHRIATNRENLDSLMLISQQSFNRIDAYLRQTNRAGLSVVIVAGVWIEGLYISTRVAQDARHPRMNDIIGEQKIVMGSLMLLLNNYRQDPNIAGLIAKLEELQTLYEDVTITHEYRPPTQVVKDGVLTFQQNDVQHINMSEETLQAIIARVQSIRHEILEANQV